MVMVLVALLVVAMATDLHRHKIYNGVTYPGIVAALGMNALASFLAWFSMADERLLASWGMIGWSASLAGFLICGGALLVCYVLFKVGGGDVKLMAMIGAFLGPERGIEVMLWTFVFGGCVGLIALVWQVGPWRLGAAGLRHLGWMLRLGRPLALTPTQRAHLRPPLHLAPSALAAALVVHFSWLDWVGQHIGL